MCTNTNIGVSDPDLANTHWGDIIKKMSYNFQIETDREEDGRWIAEIPDLPGVLAYGACREDAIRSVEALALRVLADKLEASKEKPLDPFAVTMASSIE